jgi:hypothetical protein
VGNSSEIKHYETYRRHKMDFELVGLAVAAVSTLMSLLASVFKDVILQDSNKLVSSILKTLGKATTKEPPDESHVMKRLSQTRDAYKREKRNARISGWASGLLVFGQYVVGVVLTSSFISETFSPQLIGLLGLVVLISTTLHQRYRPDLSARIAKAKACWLLTAVHKAEDSLEFIKQGLPNAPKEENIIKMLSRHLDRIEDDEQWTPEDNEEE